MKNKRISANRELSFFEFDQIEEATARHIFDRQLHVADEFLKHNHHTDVSRLQCLLRKMLPQEYHSRIDELKEYSSVSNYSISGGNNVIAPNATTATQNIFDTEKQSGDSGIRK